MLGRVLDAVGIAGIGLRMHHRGFVLYPVPVGKAGCTVLANNLDRAGPRFTRMVVRGKTRTDMAQRTALHLHICHGDVLLFYAAIVDRSLEATHGLRCPRQVNHGVRMVGQDLTDHPRIPGTHLLRVVNVIHHVERTQLAQFSGLE